VLLSRTRLWEARVADLKEAHERELKHLMRLADVLAEQIEYLRAQAARQPYISASTPALNPADLLPTGEGIAAYLTEEEEDLRALVDAGHLTETELEAQLAAAGLRNVNVQVA
jgi:hypothetical protein